MLLGFSFYCINEVSYLVDDRFVSFTCGMCDYCKYMKTCDDYLIHLRLANN